MNNKIINTWKESIYSPNTLSVRENVIAHFWKPQASSLDVTSRSGSRVTDRVTTNVKTCVPARSCSFAKRYSSAIVKLFYLVQDAVFNCFNSSPGWCDLRNDQLICVAHSQTVQDCSIIHDILLDDNAELNF